MRQMRQMALLLVVSIAPALGRSAEVAAGDFSSEWSKQHDRVWLGRAVWANPMEDWRIAGGRIECSRGGANRNVHALTHRLTQRRGSFQCSVTLGLLNGKRGSAGFELGIRSELGDYRSSLLRGRGMWAGVNSAGELFIGKPPQSDAPPSLPEAGVRLTLKGEPAGDSYRLLLTSTDREGKVLSRVEATARAEQLIGNVALVNNFATGRPAARRPNQGARFWFGDWRLTGQKFEHRDERAFGPVLYAMHSLSRDVLKLTAQMPPLARRDSSDVHLELKSSGGWKRIATSKVDALSRTATFRVESWDSSDDTPYRLVYINKDREGGQSTHHFSGLIRKDPKVRDEIVVAGFTGNKDEAFPNTRLVKNVAFHNPDVLLFTGDQIYENVGGYGIHRQPVDLAVLNYLRKIYLWGWAFRDLMRDHVSLALPDDHDVYQGNIWGNGGNSVPSIKEHARGGYAMHRDFVNAVQRTLSSHHPDPHDPTPIKQGITVYYGDMVYGRISFAVLEDRKFKSGPEGNVNSWKGRPDHVKDPNFDVARLDKPGLKLLGERQLKFLREWAGDWRGADMKLACSQTIFCNLANYHGFKQEFIVADLDSNGWPQTGRNQALRELRRGFAFHYAGDQHLASIVQHGIDEWGDAGYSFCVPSTAAGYPRAWRPDKEGRAVRNRPPPNLPNTGEYRDGFGNRVTVHAVGNPETTRRRPVLELLHDKASGYGLLRFNKRARTIKMECWRLLVDARNPRPGDQFPGWPMTIRMEDNYGRAAEAYLPVINVQGPPDPVVQVVDEADGEAVYTLRIRGRQFRPKVFKKGKYTIKVMRPEEDKTIVLKGVRSLDAGEMATLKVELP